ncbi:glycosyl transferase family 2 [Halobacteriaceae archaeon GCM10025711]
MEYTQERVATLHDLTDARPDAPTGRAAVVVPMTDREYAGLAAEGVLSTLERVDPGRVVVPLRAPRERVPAFADWLEDFDLDLEVCWCSGPAVAETLDDAGLSAPPGKGRDVWLALGVAAAESEYVVLHDADTKTFTEADVPRLLFPLDRGYDFAKGYYARVENDRLYGRLFRLFYVPLVRALGDTHDTSVLDYLAAFRYALAGEFAMTADLASRLRAPPHWGLEVGTLGDAFAHAGFAGSAQVDLGRYEHDHRAVSGPTGLSEMSRGVAETLFHVLADHGVTPDFDALPARYRETARDYVRQYAADAAFNGLTYDADAERDQVETYAGAIAPPGDDPRLPAWVDAPLDPATVRQAARDDLADARGEG